MRTSDLDIFFLSYDEPNADLHWADLLNKVPKAKRVHGVKGFDNAHKECAKQSETSRFITIDADNIVRDEFFFEEIDEANTGSVFSWAGRNHINGLVYGNGGIKCWPKHIVLNMKTHENAEEEEAKLDFCWQLDYKQMDKVFSDVYPNGSPYQAFRAGFREGVKMSLNEGKKIHYKDIKKLVHPKNYERLLIWCSVGMDVEYGDWAIYGARMGCNMTNIAHLYTNIEWDPTLLSDYSWFQLFWKTDIIKRFSDLTYIHDEVIYIGEQLKHYMDLEISLLTPEQSRFFKRVYHNPSRMS